MDQRISITMDEKVWDSPMYKFEKGKCRVFIYSQPQLNGEHNNCFNKTKTKNDNKTEDADYVYLLNFFKDEATGLGIAKKNGNLELNINKSMDQVLEHIESFDKSNEASEYDCFFFIFLTYSWASIERATSEGMKALYQDDRIQFSKSADNVTKIPVSMEQVYEKVKMCTSMVSKPKIFLIQADDARYMRKVVTVKGSETKIEPVSKKIPSDADILTICSTIPQKFGADVKLTDEPSPSFLIKAFVDTLKENKFDDFLTLTALINGNVNKLIDKNISTLKKIYEGKALEKVKDLQLPLPLVTSTLSKKLYLQ